MFTAFLGFCFTILLKHKPWFTVGADKVFGDCRFYTECLGMKLLRKRDIPEERYSNAFLGYGPEESNFAIELTYSEPSN